jgi:hypothetical protein
MVWRLYADHGRKQETSDEDNGIESQAPRSLRATNSALAQRARSW